MNKIIEYNWNYPNCSCWIERWEFLYRFFTDITEKIENPILHSPFDLISNWCSSYSDYGSDYFYKDQWKIQDIWDQGKKTIYGYEGTQYYSKFRIHVFINMRMPEDELWVGSAEEDKIIIKLLNYNTEST